MDGSAVLNIDAEKGQVEVKVFAHPTKGASAPPNDHQIRLIFDQRTDVMSKSLDGVFLADALNLFLGTLHEARG